MSSPISISEFRERRKPFPFTTTAGETYHIRVISLTAMISSGAFPSELMRTAIKMAGKAASSKEILDDSANYIRVMEEIIIHGSAEPKFIRGEGTKDALSISELDDVTKIELFNAIEGNSLSVKDQGAEIDLKPFPGESGGGVDRTGGEVLEPEAVGDDRPAGGSPDQP